MKPRFQRLRKWLWPVAVCLVLYVMLRWFEYSQVYHPDRVFDATGATLNRPFEEASFSASDSVALHGWFFPAATNSPRVRTVFLVCHGNAGNIGDRLELARALLNTGAGVLLFDYRGYGKSAGRPSEEGTYRDSQAAHGWLRGKGFAPGRIIALGESLGGGVASELAVRESIGGLVLQSSFTSTVAVGAELFPWLPVRRLATIKYDTCSKLPRIKVPVLIMHSRGDEIIGFHHSQTNYAAANEPKMFWELKGDHNGALGDPRHYTEGVERFLRRLEVTPSDRLARF